MFDYLHFALICASAAAQDLTLRGRVDVIHPAKDKARNSADVVVWLVPVTPLASRHSATPPRLVQKDKRFAPHVVAVRAGTDIQFPNQDPFMMCFRSTRGKPFDLGLYEKRQRGRQYDLRSRESPTFSAISTLR